MTSKEFSNQFDVLYNNITSNQAPGLTEYEKSVFLTKAEKEIVLNHFTPNSKGNNIGQGFDDSAKRQADFSCLVKTATCTPVSATPYVLCENADGTLTSKVAPSTLTFTNNTDPSLEITIDDFTIGNRYRLIRLSSSATAPQTRIKDCMVTVAGFPYIDGGWMTRNTGEEIEAKIDTRSFLYTFPEDSFICINESVGTLKNSNLQVIPLRFDEYQRLMSKPYKRPLKNQAWRLMNTGILDDNAHIKYVEIIVGPSDNPLSYIIRYIRKPKPIIVGSLDDLTIDGYHYTGDNEGVNETEGCELDPILHEEILQRAVELAKIAWTATGQDNVQTVMAAGQRSE